jgi:hypothetical protein
MKTFLFGQPEIDLGNLRLTTRLPEWRDQILMSVEPCKTDRKSIILAVLPVCMTDMLLLKFLKF